MLPETMAEGQRAKKKRNDEPRPERLACSMCKQTADRMLITGQWYFLLCDCCGCFPDIAGVLGMPEGVTVPLVGRKP
jgi:hypothetical protein